MNDTQRHVLALITENIHRRVLDREQAMLGNSTTDVTVAQASNDRLALEQALIRAVLSEGDAADVVGELVTCAAAAIEMWATCSGHDPLTLVQSIAITWECGADG